jgi:hypothetical protein
MPPKEPGRAPGPSGGRDVPRRAADGADADGPARSDRVPAGRLKGADRSAGARTRMMWEEEFHAETQREAETQRRRIQDTDSKCRISSICDPAPTTRSLLLSASLRPFAPLREIRSH